MKGAKWNGKKFQAGMAEQVNKIIATRKEHLEMYACAFIKKAGADVVNWELVEQVKDKEIVWFFRRRENPGSSASGH